MRVYLPATLPMLRSAVSTGTFRPIRGIGFAVTGALEREYAGADTEDLEYVAMHDAALASLRLIALDDADPVRVVLAVDTSVKVVEASADSGGVNSINGADRPGHPQPESTERGDLDRAAVLVAGSVDWSDVASVHLDGGDVADVIQAAAAAITAADLGDMDAAVTVGDAEDIDLGWYATSEIGYLLTELGAT